MGWLWCRTYWVLWKVRNASPLRKSLGCNKPATGLICHPVVFLQRHCIAVSSKADKEGNAYAVKHHSRSFGTEQHLGVCSNVQSAISSSLQVHAGFAIVCWCCIVVELRCFLYRNTEQDVLLSFRCNASCTDGACPLDRCYALNGLWVTLH